MAMASIQDQLYEFDVSTNGKVFNGLTGVLYALSDMDADVSHLCCILGSLPTTPNYAIAGPHAIDEKSLTARQKQLVQIPAYARGRDAIRSCSGPTTGGQA
jgi:hypothetical protein